MPASKRYLPPQNASNVALLEPPLRLLPLLAGTSGATLAVLVAGRALLAQLPRPTPTTPAALLALEQRWALNPYRRREAALLRAGPSQDNPDRRNRLLAGQGWGASPLAAVVLKQQALAAQAMAAPARATALWQQLNRRLGQDPASADALYALGLAQPALRQQLLLRWPAHPAALAAASERSDLTGALHLARWGARWPGAQQRIQTACRSRSLTPSQRQQLAQGLAELGDAKATLDCLGGTPALPSTSLLLANHELQGNHAAQSVSIQRLQTLISTASSSVADRAAAADAVALLSELDTAAAQSAVDRLPPRWQQTAAVQAHKARRGQGPAAALAVLQRWPTDPASWELQWQTARSAALAGRWQEVHALLQAGGARLEATMPVALQARRSFWLGLSAWQLGRRTEAQLRWQRLLVDHPGGYYGWRAAIRLGLTDPRALRQQPGAPAWMPLASGNDRVDRLWRSGQALEAWEAWRTARGGSAPDSSRGLQAEGRLREAIGDGWAGLGQLERAALRLPPGQCTLQQLIERERYRPRQRRVLAAAARSTDLPLSLLLGVAKQESRFQAGVRSVAGASGLLQLMPETAAEVAGQPLDASQLANPERNAQLGSRYLQRLMQQWHGNPMLAVASYNAGPNAVAQWLTPQLTSIPEVWVEAIPYPETRHYVKTVLGNAWSFAASRLPRCR